MAGVVQGDPDARGDAPFDAVVDRLEAVHGGLRIVDRVKRLDGVQTLAGALAVFPLGVLFLQVAGILEHDAAQVAGGAVGEHGAAVTGLDQQWQATGVIQVGMGEDHGVQSRRVEVERIAVARLVLASALDQATVDQHLHALGLDQETGTCDLARRAQKTDPHDNNLLCVGVTQP